MGGITAWVLGGGLTTLPLQREQHVTECYTGPWMLLLNTRSIKVVELLDQLSDNFS
jgi:hypothetical protein